MEKKIYMNPLTEVAKVNMSSVILTESPVNDTPTPPPGPVGAPPRTELF